MGLGGEWQRCGVREVEVEVKEMRACAVVVVVAVVVAREGKSRDVATFCGGAPAGKGQQPRSGALVMREGKRDWSSDWGAICANTNSPPSDGESRGTAPRAQ